MKKSLLQRRLENQPQYDIDVSITGVRMPDGEVYMTVSVEGESNKARASNILKMAADVVLRGNDTS